MWGKKKGLLLARFFVTRLSLFADLRAAAEKQPCSGDVHVCLQGERGQCCWECWPDRRWAAHILSTVWAPLRHWCYRYRLGCVTIDRYIAYHICEYLHAFTPTPAISRTDVHMQFTAMLCNHNQFVPYISASLSFTGDIIVTVNGVSIEGSSHQCVLDQIRKSTNCLKWVTTFITS